MKNKNDLGMSQNISRRHFINGVACAVGAVSLGNSLPSLALSTSSSNIIYPPILTGLRGTHAGAFEVAHGLARYGNKWEPQKNSSGHYDLVVVGAGVSGLSAARFYQQRHPEARILILDNHDDFGGHAKRNEFTVDGKMLIGYGGSQTMENPHSYPQAAKDLLTDLGINLKRFETAFDQNFYQRHGMQVGMYFKQLGDTKNLHTNFSVANATGDELPRPSRKQIDALPLNKIDRDKLFELTHHPKNYLSGIAKKKQLAIIWKSSYQDYLQKYAGVSATLLPIFKQITDGTYGDAFDRVSAGSAWGYAGLPGFDGLADIDYNTDIKRVTSEPYIHHFPDGNASVARLLVRKMIPTVAPGNNMDDIVTAPFDYAKLDQPENLVQIRLNSTAVNVIAGDDKTSAKITYVKDDQAYTVTATHSVLACYNGIIPYLMPELKTEQSDALKYAVKTPLTYTNVALRNWRAFHKAGISEYYCPDSFFSNVLLDFPVSFQDYQFSQSPDDPILVHLEYCPTNYGSKLSHRERYRLGRHQLLAMSFEDIELKIREQFTEMLGPYGFDATRDIAGITVNRWPHGYADGYNSHDPEWEEGKAPHEIGRKTIGNVAIANSDASARAILHAAIAQGYRAVSELI